VIARLLLMAAMLATPVTLGEVQVELARRSLRDYVRLIVWPVAEPASRFVGGFHIDAMCEHLEAVTRREIRDLLITVPPRHTKSMCCSVAWPSWAWIDHAEARFLSCSYADNLSTEHAVLSRRVIEGPRYQAAWGDRFQLATDQNVKTHFENTKRGYRMATSIGGTGTGRGGDFLLADDPHNLKKIHSDVDREAVIKWYREVWSSRFNDPKTGCRVVVMQRGHEADLAGYLLNQGGYVHLNLPTEFDPKRICVTPIGWKDPRTTEGELLCPERLGPVEVAAAKRDLTPAVFEGQHNQNPSPAGGILFNVAKLQTITEAELPAGVPFTECRGWDFAATELEPGADPDFTAGAKVRRYATGLYVVMHVEHGRYGPAEGDALLRSTAVSDGRACRQREEQEPGSAGKRVIASHVVLLAGFDYKGEPSSGSKAVRAKPFAVQVDAGNVRVLAAAWNEKYKEELRTFPAGKHDDMVDGSSTAFNELATGPGPVVVRQALLG
jgi:predicted phage terminase large subunit-like protein